MRAGYTLSGKKLPDDHNPIKASTDMLTVMAGRVEKIVVPIFGTYGKGELRRQRKARERAEKLMKPYTRAERERAAEVERAQASFMRGHRYED